jgi:hypothetical protein
MAATPDMTRKRRRTQRTTESLSSDKTARSKRPKDVLGLGAYLVRELGLKDNDTLGRWMAHYVAELMAAAKQAPTPAERRAAKENASATILRLWNHRQSMPHRGYPLRPYEETLALIERLRPSNNPFEFYWAGARPQPTREDLAAKLFNKLSRLVIGLLLHKLPRDKAAPDKVAVQALDRAEQQVLARLREWGELFEKEESSVRRQPTRRAKTQTSEETTVDVDAAILRLLDETATTVEAVREQVTSSRLPTTSPPKESNDQGRRRSKRVRRSSKSI